MYRITGVHDFDTKTFNWFQLWNHDTQTFDNVWVKYPKSKITKTLVNTLVNVEHQTTKKKGLVNFGIIITNKFILGQLAFRHLLIQINLKRELEIYFFENFDDWKLATHQKDVYFCISKSFRHDLNLYNVKMWFDFIFKTRTNINKDSFNYLLAIH